jgi:hypothetical protein
MLKYDLYAQHHVLQVKHKIYLEFTTTMKNKEQRFFIHKKKSIYNKVTL